MTNEALLAKLTKFVADSHGRVGQVMAACDVSESTVRKWLTRKKPPRNARVREALEALLAQRARA